MPQNRQRLLFWTLISQISHSCIPARLWCGDVEKNKGCIMKKQQPKPDFEKWQKWQKNLERINDELLLIDHSRKIFLKVWDVINQNSELKKHLNGVYLNWLRHNYCVKLGMGIRRLVDPVDPKKNVSSMYSFLRDIKIKKYTQQINVDNLAQYFAHSRPNTSEGYSTHCYGLALKAYKKAFGSHRKKLLLRDLKKDIDLALIETKKIKDYVDKNWAHTDKNKDRFETPKVLKAHDCLDTLIKIYTRYSLLIGGHEFKPYPESVLTDWDEPLRILWVQ